MTASSPRHRPAAAAAALPAPGAYRPEIDGLRAVAVLAVLINHIDHRWLPGGYLGVDLFFVISGWVVTGSLLRHSHTSWRQFLVAFYARRVRRLLPALVACVLLSSLLGALVIAPQALERLASLRTGLASLVGLSNLYQLRQSTDYFGSSAELNLFTHTWSLGVEEQYYLVYPILVGLCGLVRGRAERVRRRLALLLLLLISASLLFQAHLWASDQAGAAFFLTSARFWELGLGALGCVLLPSLRLGGAPGSQASPLDAEPRGPRPTGDAVVAPALEGQPIAAGTDGLPAAAGPAGAPASRRPSELAERLAALFPWIAGLAAAALLVSLVLPLAWQQPATLTAGLASALLLPALALPSPLQRALARPPLVAIGLRSYSLYLWHWPLLVLARWTIGLEGPALAVVLLLIVLVSEASYRWLETPLRRRRWGATNAAAIGRAALLLLLSGAAVLGLERRGDALFIGRHRFNAGPWFDTVGVAGTRLRGDRCNAIPTDGPQLPLAMRRDCRAESSTPRRPPAVPARQPRALAVLGDSHALHLLPLLEQLQQRHGLPVLALSRSACVMPAPGPSVQAGCQGFSQAAIAEALAFTAPSRGTVVLSNYLYGHFRPGGDLARQFRRPDGGLAGDTGANLQAWAAAVGGLAEQLARQGGTLVVVAPTPEQRSRFGHPQLCRTEWFRPVLPAVCRRSSTSRRVLLQDRQPILQALQAQARRHPNLVVFDPFETLCPGPGDCASDRNGTVLFRDKDHLSAAAVRSLTPPFEALLRRRGLL